MITTMFRISRQLLYSVFDFILKTSVLFVVLFMITLFTYTLFLIVYYIHPNNEYRSNCLIKKRDIVRYKHLLAIRLTCQNGIRSVIGMMDPHDTFLPEYSPFLWNENMTGLEIGSPKE